MKHFCRILFVLSTMLPMLSYAQEKEIYSVEMRHSNDSYFEHDKRIVLLKKSGKKWIAVDSIFMIYRDVTFQLADSMLFVASKIFGASKVSLLVEIWDMKNAQFVKRRDVHVDEHYLNMASKGSLSIKEDVDLSTLLSWSRLLFVDSTLLMYTFDSIIELDVLTDRVVEQPIPRFKWYWE